MKRHIARTVTVAMLGSLLATSLVSSSPPGAVALTTTDCYTEASGQAAGYTSTSSTTWYCLGSSAWTTIPGGGVYQAVTANSSGSSLSYNVIDPLQVRVRVFQRRWYSGTTQCTIRAVSEFRWKGLPVTWIDAAGEAGWDANQTIYAHLPWASAMGNTLGVADGLVTQMRVLRTGWSQSVPTVKAIRGTNMAYLSTYPTGSEDWKAYDSPTSGAKARSSVTMNWSYNDSSRGLSAFSTWAFREAHSRATEANPGALPLSSIYYDSWWARWGAVESTITYSSITDGCKGNLPDRQLFVQLAYDRGWTSGGNTDHRACLERDSSVTKATASLALGALLTAVTAPLDVAVAFVLSAFAGSLIDQATVRMTDCSNQDGEQVKYIPSFTVTIRSDV